MTKICQVDPIYIYYTDGIPLHAQTLDVFNENTNSQSWPTFADSEEKLWSQTPFDIFDHGSSSSSLLCFFMSQ